MKTTKPSDLTPAILPKIQTHLVIQLGIQQTSLPCPLITGIGHAPQIQTQFIQLSDHHGQLPRLVHRHLAPTILPRKSKPAQHSPWTISLSCPQTSGASHCPQDHNPPCHSAWHSAWTTSLPCPSPWYNCTGRLGVKHLVHRHLVPAILPKIQTNLVIQLGVQCGQPPCLVHRPDITVLVDWA